MKYLVTGFKTETYDNNYGMEMQEEKLIDESKHVTSEFAEKAAKKALRRRC